MKPEFHAEIEKILKLVPEQDRPLSRLEKGTPVAKGREAVAKSAFPLLAQAALYIYFDCFNEAHDIAQEHEGSVAGNWVHAIVHRREPDASNSKYWYHRVKFPDEVVRDITGELVKLKISQTFPAWEPTAFVDLCEKFRKKSSADPTFQTLARIQQIEWRALLNYILKA